jgi:hypothetical protein
MHYIQRAAEFVSTATPKNSAAAEWKIRRRRRQEFRPAAAAEFGGAGH